MTFYVISLLILAILAAFEQYSGIKNRTIIRLVLFIAINLCFSAAISRGDYCSYADMYHRIGAGQNVVVEKAYIYISFLLNLFTKEPFYIFFIYGLVAIAVKFIALYILEKNTKFINFSLFFVIYSALFILYLEKGAMRFAVAQSFVMLAGIYFIYYKNLLNFLVIILIGTLFHLSAISAIAIPILVYSNYKHHIIYFLLALILGVSFSFVYLHFQYDAYYSSLIESSAFFSRFWHYSRFGHVHFNFQILKEIFIFLAFLIFFYKDIKYKKHKFIWLIWVFKIYSFILLGGLFFNHLVVSRFMLFYSVFDPIILVLIIHKLSLKSLKIMAIIALSVLLTSNYVITLYRIDEYNIFTLPYKNYFLGDKINCSIPKKSQMGDDRKELFLKDKINKKDKNSKIIIDLVK